jgi:hypothetical protein
LELRKKLREHLLNQLKDLNTCDRLFCQQCHPPDTQGLIEMFFEQLELLRKESKRGEWRQVDISADVYQGRGCGQCLTCGEGKC